MGERCKAVQRPNTTRDCVAIKRLPTDTTSSLSRNPGMSSNIDGSGLTAIDQTQPFYSQSVLLVESCTELINFATLDARQRMQIYEQVSPLCSGLTPANGRLYLSGPSTGPTVRCWLYQTRSLMPTLSPSKPSETQASWWIVLYDA